MVERSALPPALASLPGALAEARLAPELAASLAPVYASLLADLRRTRARLGGRPIVVGICGAQGSGKSTLAGILQQTLTQAEGLRVAVLSLDDLYLGSRERARLAATVHPLLRTRGVPGTHDVALGIELIGALTRSGARAPVRLPRFDKLADEPWPAERWPLFDAPADLVLFEGWCVGARAQAPQALQAPVNELEAGCDPDGRWRHYVNAQLAGPYAALFGLLDHLLLLQAPGFEVVYGWRREQEIGLALRRQAPPPATASMSDAQLRRFIQHYERLTRHLLAEMPARADVVLELDAQRRVQAMRYR